MPTVPKPAPLTVEEKRRKIDVLSIGILSTSAASPSVFPEEWHPLENDSDCFMLVDLLCSEGWSFTLYMGKGQNCARFFRHGVKENLVVANPDRRTAIVLAAIRTTGVGVADLG